MGNGSVCMRVGERRDELQKQVLGCVGGDFATTLKTSQQQVLGEVVGDMILMFRGNGG